jgi:hypothetical protein
VIEIQERFIGAMGEDPRGRHQAGKQRDGHSIHPNVPGQLCPPSKCHFASLGR